MLVMVIGRTGELNSNITSPKQYDILKHPTLPLPELKAATCKNSKGYLNYRRTGRQREAIIGPNDPDHIWNDIWHAHSIICKYAAV